MIASAIFRDLWDQKLAGVESEKKSLRGLIAKIDIQIGQFLDRIVTTEVPTVISAYEERIRQLEGEKLLLKERLQNGVGPIANFEETLRTALDFLANPWNLWRSGSLPHRKTVLRLTFAERLRYSRKNGFRTANLSLPFKVLGKISDEKNKMARSERFERQTLRFVVCGVDFLPIAIAYYECRYFNGLCDIRLRSHSA